MMSVTEVFLYLIGCALNDHVPDDKYLVDTDLEKLFSVAKLHSVVCIIGYSLEKTACFKAANADIQRRWHDAKEKAIRKCIIFDAERVSLTAEFEKQGIWYMPLKGIVLKDYYPRYGMREMSDNDILFDSHKRKAVKEIFEARGYDISSYEKSIHDVYKKAPVLNFEMHTQLYSSDISPILATKYENVRTTLLTDDNSEFSCHFSDEDYYVYYISHAYKHYSHAGTGIRTLTDFFIMNRQFSDKIDRDYVDHELQTLGLLDYERASKLLAQMLFEKPERISELNLSDTERTMLGYYLHSGVYGNTENMITNELHMMGLDTGKVSFKIKCRYVFKRLFPNREWCKKHYPVIYEHPILMPGFWIWRIIDRGVRSLPAIIREWRAVRNTK